MPAIKVAAGLGEFDSAADAHERRQAPTATRYCGVAVAFACYRAMGLLTHPGRLRSGEPPPPGSAPRGKSGDDQACLQHPGTLTPSPFLCSATLNPHALKPGAPHQRQHRHPRQPGAGREPVRPPAERARQASYGRVHQLRHQPVGRHDQGRAGQRSLNNRDAAGPRGSAGGPAGPGGPARSASSRSRRHGCRRRQWLPAPRRRRPTAPCARRAPPAADSGLRSLVVQDSSYRSPCPGDAARWRRRGPTVTAEHRRRDA